MLASALWRDRFQKLNGGLKSDFCFRWTFIIVFFIYKQLEFLLPIVYILCRQLEFLSVIFFHSHFKSWNLDWSFDNCLFMRESVQISIVYCLYIMSTVKISWFFSRSKNGQKLQLNFAGQRIIRNNSLKKRTGIFKIFIKLDHSQLLLSHRLNKR